MARVLPIRPEIVEWTNSQKRWELSARIFAEERRVVLCGILDEPAERMESASGSAFNIL
ncbi:hypothetical protein MSKU3_0464 [Komagataeibacter oboediens]|nr:hypothetical protein MSKU3_0464 [Komagataeibacter oboediens]